MIRQMDEDGMEDRESREEFEAEQNTRIYLGRSSGKSGTGKDGRTHYDAHAGGNGKRKVRRKQPKGPSVIQLVLKILLMFVLILFLWADGAVMIGYVVDYTDEQDETWHISGCDRYYYEGNYAGLRDYMDLYHLYSEDYDMYWERVNGYEDYVAWLQWNNTSDEILAGSEEKAEMYRQKVIGNASNCQFEKNRKTLENWENLVE